MMMTTSDKIRIECDKLCETLTHKNRDYGDSAFRVPVLCPDVPDTTVLIRARMSDKIERLSTLLGASAPAQVAESIEDTVRDLAGYCILWLIQLRGRADVEDRF